MLKKGLLYALLFFVNIVVFSVIVSGAATLLSESNTLMNLGGVALVMVIPFVFYADGLILDLDKPVKEEDE